MKKYILLIIVLSVFCVKLSGQRLNTVEKNNFWGNDVIVNNHEISGKFSAVQKSNGEIILGIIDSLTIPGEGLRIMASQDMGASWFGIYTIIERLDYRDIKLLCSGEDSIYVFYKVYNELYLWNLLQGVKWTGISDVISYDVILTPNNTFHLFCETSSHNIQHYWSIDRGFNWIGPTLFIYTGARPEITELGTSDYFNLVCYHDVVSPPEYSKIACYYMFESSPGVLQISLPYEVTTGGRFISEFDVARYQDKVWVLYSDRVGNDINIYGKYSTNGGTIFSDSLLIATDPDIQEYYMDVRANSELEGFDLIYYRDSVDLTQLTNETDRLIYSTDFIADPNFISKNQISQHPPYWSPTEYAPKIVPLPFSQAFSDVGILWMGYDNGENKLFYDSYFFISENEKNVSDLSNDFKLFNNFPNPFNPSTRISYKISEAGEVNIELFNVMGEKIGTLLSSYIEAGNHSFNFNADHFVLASGVYFYKLVVKNSSGKDLFTATNKMMLMK